MSDKTNLPTEDDVYLVTEEPNDNKRKMMTRIIILIIASVLLIFTTFCIIYVFTLNPNDNSWLSNILNPEFENANEKSAAKFLGLIFIGLLITSAIVGLILTFCFKKKTKK